MELIVQEAGPAGRTEPVSIERTAEGFRVRVGGRTYEIDAAHAGARRADLSHLSLRVGGDQHEVAVEPGPLDHPGRYRVNAAGGTHTLDVSDPLAHLARAGAGRAGRGGGKVVARMPGRVVAVLAAEGDAVEEGQGIVVLEAMKMENEIAADRGGNLKKVHVTPGQAVESGEPLFEVG